MKRCILIFFAFLQCLSIIGCCYEPFRIPVVDDTDITQATASFETNPAETEQTPSESTAVVLQIPNDDDFVCVNLYAPEIKVSLSYATTDNFTGTVIYKFADAYLRYGTLTKLIKVNQALNEHGVALVIWDGFRPVSAQQKLWEVCPDPKYVSHPKTGNRNHCRGNTVDVTLCDLKTGELLDMPTAFDDFSKRADRNYSDCTNTQKKNALLLENTMKKYGFKPYSAEWWHYTDKNDYPVDENFDPALFK